MKNLKIAFFGGTFVHEKISKNCEKLGAKCYLLDKSKNCYSSNNANFINIDFNNLSKTISFIKRNKINFLYISQSDVGLKSIGKINNLLNLPGIDFSNAERLTNKFSIRKILKDNGFFQPLFFLYKKSFNKKLLNDKNYLLKPVDSSGSRGIFDLSKKSVFTKLFKKSLSFSKQKKLIIEEKIEGIEFGAQTFSVNGSCSFVVLHEDIMSKINPKIPAGHIMPFKIFSKKKILEIENKIKKAINILGVKNGPCNVDCIYTKKKELFILEVSPRLGATCLPEMLKIYTGIDWDINTIKLYNNIPIKKIKKSKKINVISRVFESKISGYLLKYAIKKIIPSSEIKFLIKKSKKIEKFTDGTKLFGYIVAYSNKRKYLIDGTLKTLNSMKLTISKFNDNNS